MNHLSAFCLVLLLLSSYVFAEPAVVKLRDGRFGKADIIDTTAIRDSTILTIKMKAKGIVEAVKKNKISFIIFNNDTIHYRKLTRPTQITIAENDTTYRFGNKKSFWLSGSFGFSTIGMKDVESRQNALLIRPTLRFFPTQSFFLGPRLQWIGLYEKYSSINQFGVGIDIGFLNKSDKPTRLYLRSGFQFDAYTFKYSNYGNSNDSEIGFTWPIGVGMFVRLSKSVYLQFEPSYQLQVIRNSSMNVFSISLGFAGISKNSCISTLQTLSSYY